MTKEIKVVDYMMGTGKSTYILDMLATSPSTRFIYIAPLLTEIEERAKDSLSSVEIRVPSDDEGSKTDSMLELLRDGHNIACTHSLFTNMTQDHFDSISYWKYTLVIDEVVDFISPYGKYGEDDVNDLFDKGELESDENNKGMVSMNWKVRERNHFSKLMNMCKAEMIYSSKSPANMLNIQIPPKMIEAAKEVYVLTYMYEASTMKKFMEMHNFIHTKEIIQELSLKQVVKKQQAKELLNIVSIKAVDEMFKRQKDTWFSQTWYIDATNKTKIKTALKKLDNYLVNNSEKRKEYFFCTPKHTTDLIDSIKPRKDKETGEVISPVKYKYLKTRLKEDKGDRLLVPAPTKSEQDGKYQLWLPITCRATNSYAKRSLCIYLINIYPNWNVQKYLNDYHSPVENDAYALSEMLQFIWRGCIREGKPMDVYIASTRMKRLLENWLNEL